MANDVKYTVNYEDKRFKDVEADKKTALSDLEKTFGGMIDNSQKFYQDQINASKQWANEQTKLQQEQTDFAIDKIEQQKVQAEKDYTKEQSGAYVDWQKESNKYGANAEQVAAQGLANTGYSESSQVSMFNTYQNRVATAREVFNNVIANFDNGIREAQLQNNAALAEIRYEAQKQQLELALEGFQYKNTLVMEKANKKTEIENTYYGRYKDVLAQLNTENALAEEVRQYNESKALEEAKLAEQKRQYNQSLAMEKAKLAEDRRQFNVLHSSSGSSGGGGSSGGSSGGSIKKSSSESSSSKKSSSSGGAGRKFEEHGGAGRKFEVSATSYLNELIKSGASKDKVSNEIAIALREGAITKEEAAKLRATFTPRGIQY